MQQRVTIARERRVEHALQLYQAQREIEALKLQSAAHKRME